jgi:hypothetical protein
MAQIASINFVDKDSGQPGFVGIRVQGAVVGLTLSLQDDGDIEVFLGSDDARRLLDALEQARAAMGALP